MDATDLVKTEYGFYTQAVPPTREELNEYYTNRYYQEGLGSYSVSYTGDELAWNRVRAENIARNIETLVSKRPLSLIDIGCGEGWLLDAMLKRGHRVLGVDFSVTGMRRWHPHLTPFFRQGEILQEVEVLLAENRKCDVVFLGNVIEHMLDPVGTVDILKKILNEDGYMVLVAPNDFSELQEEILRRKPDLAPWWFYFEHISYFNLESMRNLLAGVGFTVERIVGDYPIEFDLFMDDANYVRDRSAGRDSHKKRMRSDVFLYNKNPETFNLIYSALGEIGVGRNLIFYARLGG